jgi:hypothetical protein
LTSCTGIQKGAVIGGVAGAGTGAAVGGGKGAVIGGVVGTAAGAIIGDYMDKQKEDLEKVPGADVEKVGDELVVTFQSPILPTPTLGARRSAPAADESANHELPDTDGAEGLHRRHGSEEHNQQPSERRSRKSYLTRGRPPHACSRSASREMLVATTVRRADSEPPRRAANRR